MTGDEFPPVPPLRAGLGCRCPRCGRGRLFDGLLQVAARCDKCDLDFSPHDSGDGPAVFVILLLGALVIPFVFVLENTVRPPIWVHALIWPPVVLVLAIAMLRPAKAILVALHYKNLRHEYHGGN